MSTAAWIVLAAIVLILAVGIMIALRPQRKH
jgi:hypothetical protein